MVGMQPKALVVKVCGVLWLAFGWGVDVGPGPAPGACVAGYWLQLTHVGMSHGAISAGGNSRQAR